MKIIIVILAATLIFLGIKIIRLGIKYLLKLRPGLDFPGKILIVTEFLIWFIFVFKSTDFLFREKFYYQYIVVSYIVIFLGFFTWFFMRDIFAGFIFRIKYSFKTGTYISAGELSRTALLNTPWSSLKEEPIIRFVKENEKGYFFEITLFSVKMKHIKLIEIALDNVPLLHIVTQKESSNALIA